MYNLIGFLSDAHGNGKAFDRGIKLLLEQGAERFYFLGDAIGYIPSAAVLESINLLGHRVKCIRGNHEAMLLEGKSDPEREDIYQLDALRSVLTNHQLMMMSSWPVLYRESVNGLNILLVHGSPTNPTFDYVYPDTDLAGFSPEADFVFMGNTHHPFVRQHAGTCYVNVGSCGMPRDDGRYGSVALLDTKLRTVRILRFDITLESKEVLDNFSMIHPSVKDIYKRRQSKIVGEIL